MNENPLCMHQNKTHKLILNEHLSHLEFVLHKLAKRFYVRVTLTVRVITYDLFCYPIPELILVFCSTVCVLLNLIFAHLHKLVGHLDLEMFLWFIGQSKFFITATLYLEFEISRNANTSSPVSNNETDLIFCLLWCVFFFLCLVRSAAYIFILYW